MIYDVMTLMRRHRKKEWNGICDHRAILLWGYFIFSTLSGNIPSVLLLSPCAVQSWLALSNQWWNCLLDSYIMRGYLYPTVHRAYRLFIYRSQEEGCYKIIQSCTNQKLIICTSARCMWQNWRENLLCYGVHSPNLKCSHLDKFRFGLHFIVWSHNKETVSVTCRNQLECAAAHGNRFPCIHNLAFQNKELSKSSLFWLCDLDPISLNLWPITLKSISTRGTITTNVCSKFENNQSGIW